MTNELVRVGEFCPYEDGEDYGKPGRGNRRKYGKTDRGVQRYPCKRGGRTFTAPRRVEAQEIIEVLALLAAGMRIRSVTRLKGVKEDTILDWLWEAARHMRAMGLAAITPGPNLSRRHPQHTVYPYRLRGVTAAYPNHVWGIDITYIRLIAGWMYLVAVLDWFSRYVVAWELDLTLGMPFVLTAVHAALRRATPAIWNSDQGSPFTSPQYTALLLDAGVQISMDGRGRALDNVFTERLWRTVKDEEVYLHDYVTPRDARAGLSRYFAFYNHERPHQALDYLTPAEVYVKEMRKEGIH